MHELFMYVCIYIISDMMSRLVLALFSLNTWMILTTMKTPGINASTDSTQQSSPFRGSTSLISFIKPNISSARPQNIKKAANIMYLMGGTGSRISGIG